MHQAEACFAQVHSKKKQQKGRTPSIPIAAARFSLYSGALTSAEAEVALGFGVGAAGLLLACAALLLLEHSRKCFKKSARGTSFWHILQWTSSPDIVLMAGGSAFFGTFFFENNCGHIDHPRWINCRHNPQADC